MLKNGSAKFGGGGNAKQLEGQTEDLTGARLVTTMIVNGVPRTAIEIVEGVRKFRYVGGTTGLSPGSGCQSPCLPPPSQTTGISCSTCAAHEGWLRVDQALHCIMSGLSLASS